MSTVDQTLARHGGLSYLEIPAIDVEKSGAFYEGVLEWTVHDDDRTKFYDRTGHLIGRWVVGHEISRRPGWVPYFYVNNIVEALDHTAAKGGEIVRPPYVQGNLLIATARDPAGNVIGLWQERG